MKTYTFAEAKQQCGMPTKMTMEAFCRTFKVAPQLLDGRLVFTKPQVMDARLRAEFELGRTVP